MGDVMTDKELIAVLIDKYTDLQRIRKANGDTINTELDYQIKVAIAKLSSMGDIRGGHNLVITVTNNHI